MCESAAPEFNGSLLQENVSQVTYESATESHDHKALEDALYRYMLPSFCCFGILGNMLNLVILSRKSLTMHMERLEKCAHAHLLALALSDLMYCVSALPRSSMPSFVHATYISGWLLYDTYHSAVLNTFLLCSSWLTVAMAVSRYIAICYPVKARQHMGITATRTVITLIFFFSICFNMPRYFSKSIHSHTIPCSDGMVEYYAFHGPLRQIPHAEEIYLWIYFVIGIIFPLIAVAYCNFYFIRALQSSKRLRRQYSHPNNATTTIPAPSQHARSNSSSNSSSAPNILTLTLSIIVLLYIVLVTPAEIIQFFKQTVRRRFRDNLRVWSNYSLALAVCNNMQTLNFSVNFLLYCMINVHFRRVISNALCHARHGHAHAHSQQSIGTSLTSRPSFSERSSMLNHTITVNVAL